MKRKGLLLTLKIKFGQQLKKNIFGREQVCGRGKEGAGGGRSIQ